MVQSVTVPGPIKAAATNGPGPMFLKIFFKSYHFKSTQPTFSI